MIQTSTPRTLTAALGLALFASISLSSCGDSPNATVGNPSEADLTAIAVTEITADGSSSSDISLSWDGIPGSARSLKFFRRQSSEPIGNADEITKLDDTTQNTLKDSDPSLAPATPYIYSIRADNANNIAVASAQSAPISIIGAASVPSFNVTTPAQGGATLKDPLGTGHQFSWQDAGTGLYHVQVSDAAGKVLWGAITKNTTISYGTASGTERREGGISGPADPKLEVPVALTEKLTISSPNPNSARNEVAFEGIGDTGSYRIQVSAIETLPTKGDLKGARSIAIRRAQEVRFIAQ